MSYRWSLYLRMLGKGLQLDHLIYPRRSTDFGILVFFTTISLMEFQVRYLALFLLLAVIGSFACFWKSLQEYPFIAGVPQGSILIPTLVLLYINDIPDDVPDDSGLWQQLQLASELEYDLRDTMNWGRKQLVDFNAWKTQLVSFDRSKNTGVIDVKMDGPVLEEKSYLKMLGSTFSYKLAWGSYIISIAKTSSKKSGALIRSIRFLFPI